MSNDEIKKNTRWFEKYMETLRNNSVFKEPQDGVSYPCPCCGYKTLDSRGGFEICSVCFWEDDGQDDHDADAIRGGPNGGLSLTQARVNFRKFGAVEERFTHAVRRPLPEEGG
ncbi:MAG: CPCC family cysteine-rich protein [Blastocatellia bacterium]